MMNRWLSFLILIMVGLGSVWPMIKCWSCIADYGRDGYLLNWIINTSGENIYGLYSGYGKSLFDGNILYPYKNVLAYSDMHMLTALWAFPMGQLLADPTIVSGLALVAGQLLTWIVIYFWWKKISSNSWAAMIATLAFGLSQLRFEYQVHLQMWGMEYWLLATWLIVEWLQDKDKRGWRLYAGAILLGLQVWESLLPVFFAGVIIMAALINNTPLVPPLNLSLAHGFAVRGGSWKRVIYAIFIFAIIAALPLFTYWQVGQEFNFQRSIREAAHNGLSVDEIWGKYMSPGLYVLFVLIVIKIFNFQFTIFNQGSNTKFSSFDKNNKNIKWLGVVLIISLVMALGPVLKWEGKTVKIGGVVPVPLPYAAAYYAVPGFGALRTPSRWIWVVGWAASGIIAIEISSYQLSVNSFRKTLGILSLILLTVVGGETYFSI